MEIEVILEKFMDKEYLKSYGFTLVTRSKEELKKLTRRHHEREKV